MLELLTSEMVYSICSSQPQEAVFWFIPVLIGAAIGTAAIIIAAASEDTNTEKVKGTSLGILGMPGAGKTLFLRNLQGRPYTKYEQTSGAEDYEPFDFCHKGKTIRIQKGKDIGGNVENIKQYYDDFLNTKDICIFIFDLNKYIDQTNYRNEVNSRLDFINRHLLILDKSLDKWAVIGTHVDQAKIEKGKSIIDVVQGYVQGKPYARLFNTNFFARNITNKSDMDIIIDKLF